MAQMVWGLESGVLRGLVSRAWGLGPGVWAFEIVIFLSGVEHCHGYLSGVWATSC